VSERLIERAGKPTGLEAKSRRRNCCDYQRGQYSSSLVRRPPAFVVWSMPARTMASADDDDAGWLQ